MSFLLEETDWLAKNKGSKCIITSIGSTILLMCVLVQRWDRFSILRTLRPNKPGWVLVTHSCHQVFPYEETEPLHIYSSWSLLISVSCCCASSSNQQLIKQEERHLPYSQGLYSINDYWCDFYFNRRSGVKLVPLIVHSQIKVIVNDVIKSTTESRDHNITVRWNRACFCTFSIFKKGTLCILLKENAKQHLSIGE